MKQFLLYIIPLFYCFSCNINDKNDIESNITESVAIFEIYLQDSNAVDHLSIFLRDTLKLPVEWEPFDIFGNDVVYDSAFFLGNTTLELLSVNPADTTIRKEGKFNRILFNSKNIDSTSSMLSKANIEQTPPFDFKIASSNSELKIGRQINLDCLSKQTNINVAFWEYHNDGYNFAERTIKANTLKKLKPKLKKALATNPMDITGLKEIHLSITQSTIDQWCTLLGPSKNNKWNLDKGPVISFTLNTKNVGVEWIALNVLNIDVATEFLTQKKMLLSDNKRIGINPSKVYGLQIFVEQ